MSWRHALISLLLVALSIPNNALAQEPCPGNPLANASMEEGSRGTAGLGTRPSSIVANAWNPWSTWGYSPYSGEAEFEIEDISRLGRYSTYRVHTGQFSQKFSSGYGVHNAGFYQRVAVPEGSTVTFSIWVQIYTGEQHMHSDANDELLSDLNNAGNYRAYVGIDPYGDEPAGFGAPPSERTVWCDPVIDRDTRRYSDTGLPYDGWVQIEVTTRAQADHITVLTRGQPEFPVRVNVSYWDDACLRVVAPTPAPTATSVVTPTPKPTASPTAAPTPSPTAMPTATLSPTATSAPTDTPVPAATPTREATATAAPTFTSVPTSVPTVKPPAATRARGDNPFLLLAFAVVWLSAAGYIGWSFWQRRQTHAGSKPDS